MGSRRVSRKRLYNVEKEGIDIDIGAAVGIKNAIVSSTQHRNGRELITEILIDLGTSKDDIVAGGSGGQAIGKASTACAIVDSLTIAKFGVITEVRLVCLENIAAATNGEDIDLIAAPSGNSDKVQGFDVAGISSAVSLFAGGGAVVKGKDNSHLEADNTLENHSLYLADGTGSASGAYNAVGKGGKLAIYIHGFEVPADL